MQLCAQRTQSSPKQFSLCNHKKQLLPLANTVLIGSCLIEITQEHKLSTLFQSGQLSSINNIFWQLILIEQQNTVQNSLPKFYTSNIFILTKRRMAEIIIIIFT